MLNLSELPTAREPDCGPERHSGGVRVLIVSGVRLYREGLALTLAVQPWIEVGTTPPVDAVEAAATFTPDVILIDSLSVMNTELVKRLAEQGPAGRIVAFAVADDTDRELAAFAEAGVAGFVGKDASAEELVAVIEAVARGEVRCSPRVAGLLVRRLSSRAINRRERAVERVLTARERTVLALVEEGLSNKEIGGRLGIEVSTVKNHMHNVLGKIDVTRRGQAVSWLRSQAVGAREEAIRKN